MAIHYVDGECSYVELPPTAIDRLNSRINNTNSRINTVSNEVANITPYVEEKTAYIGDTECSFTKAKDGIITANLITESGEIKSISMEIFDNVIIVKFAELEELATVSISIQ